MNDVSKPGVHLLYASLNPDTDEFKELDSLLRAHHPGVRVSAVRQGYLLQDWLELPFLDTSDGLHITGLQAIRQYIEATDPVHRDI